MGQPGFMVPGLSASQLEEMMRLPPRFSLVFQAMCESISRKDWAVSLKSDLVDRSKNLIYHQIQALVRSTLNLIEIVEVGEAKKDLDTLEATWRSRVTFEKNVAEEALAEKNEALARLESASSEITRLEVRVADLEAECSLAKEEVKEARSIADDARAELRKSTEEVQQTRAAIQEAWAEAASVRVEIGHARVEAEANLAKAEAAQAEAAEVRAEADRIRAELTAKLNEALRMAAAARDSSYKEGFNKGRELEPRWQQTVRERAVEAFKASEEYAQIRDADYAAACKDLVDLIRQERPEWDLSFMYTAGTPQVPSVDLTGEDEEGVEAAGLDAPAGGEGQARDGADGEGGGTAGGGEPGC